MGAELDRSHEETNTIAQLRRSAYENLFKQLEEYAAVKEKSYLARSGAKQKQLREAM